MLAWVGGDSRQLSDNAIELGFLPDDNAVRLKWQRGIGYVWPFTFFALLMFFESLLTMIIPGAATYALTGPLVVGSILYLRKNILADSLRSGPAATGLLYLALTVMLLIGAGTIYALF